MSFITFQLAPYGDLCKLLVGRLVLPRPVAMYYGLQLIDTIKFMHDTGVCHRDLKLENILLDEQFDLKLIDFGSACLIEERCTDFIGTRNYMAPEIHLKSASYEPHLADIFSLGVILFNLYSGSAPFTMAKNDDPFYSRFVTATDSFWDVHERGRLPRAEGETTFFTDDFRDLIEGALAFEPSKRLTLS